MTVERQIAMAELAGSSGVISGDVAVTAQAIAVGDQSLQTDGTAWRQAWVLMPTSALPCGSHRERVEQSRYTPELSTADEAISHRRIASDDGVGVARAVAADVIKGDIQIGNTRTARIRSRYPSASPPPRQPP